MSFLGLGASFGSALLGTAIGKSVTGGINSAYASRQAQLEAKLQRENWEYAQKNAHQFEVQDLRSAGLNPILSATNSQAIGIPSAPSGNISTDNDVNSAYAAREQLNIAKIQAKTDQDKAKADADNAEANKITAQAAKDNAETNRMDVLGKLPVYNAQSSKEVAEADKIRQDLINSIQITEALVEKYGAESVAARGAASAAFANAKLALEQVTGQQYSNQEAKLILEDPRRHLDRETFSRVEHSWLWSGIYGLGQFVRSVNPFGTISVGKSGTRVGSHN